VPGLPRLELDTDGRALVPAAAPEVRFDREVRRLFDVRDPIAVVIRSSHREGIFHPAALRRVVELTTALRELEGVRPRDVASLATEPGFRHRPGQLTFRTLLEPLPQSPEELAELRSDLRRIELYDGTLISADGRATAILVGAPPAADRSQLVREIRRRAAAVLSSGRPVVLDASFRCRRQRQAARRLAAAHRVPFDFVECRAELGALRQRHHGSRGALR